MNKISLRNFGYKFILMTKWNIESIRLRVLSLAFHLYYVIRILISIISFKYYLYEAILYK